MSLALYRKYRPGSLSEVIGQDHVVEPLKRALTNDRVHHAYLFSGPRGCGKTSSARILARALNCVNGPTPDPCGECNSCIELAPNGPGSLDVIELDAATHGLVDDARDLREKAIYAPATSRYKIYIIDEAHQLGPGAANALLKLVEEPPPHLRFVFATTEPDKIIGTIRSRTHHYGFRLVPARTLQQHLAKICESEGLKADPGALALVSCAAGGSVRDSLSILGQLLAGAGDEGLTYDEAAEQLGVTNSALIDQVVTAMASYDAAALFRAVDAVVESGHDPRRFVTDLLERMRDLLIVAGVPDAAEAGLIAGPDEHIAELHEQAGRFGPGELSRHADLISRGLSEIKGATAPRLQLELLVARLAVPAADLGTDTLVARVEALEKGTPVPAATPGTLPSTGAPASAGPAGAGASTVGAAGPQSTGASHVKPTAPKSAEGPPPRPQLSEPRPASPAAAPPAASPVDPASESRPSAPVPAYPAAQAPHLAETSHSAAPPANPAGGLQFAGSSAAPPAVPAQAEVAVATNAGPAESASAAAAPSEHSSSEPPPVAGPPPRLSQVAPSVGAGPMATGADEPVPSNEAIAPADAGSVPAVPARDAVPQPVAAARWESEPAAAPVESALAVAHVEATSGGGVQGVSIEQVRALWQSVLDDVKSRSRVAWVLLVDAHPVSIDGNTLLVSHSDAGTVKRFGQSAAHEDKVRLAMQAVIGVPLKMQMINADPPAVAATATTDWSRPSAPIDEISDSVDVSDADSIELLQKQLGGVKIDERDDG